MDDVMNRKLWKTTFNREITLFVLIFELYTGIIDHFLISLRIVHLFDFYLVPLNRTAGYA